MRLARPQTVNQPGTQAAHIELKRQTRSIFQEFAPEGEQSKAAERAGLLGIWSWMLADTAAELKRLKDLGELKPHQRRELSWVMGVATDKLQLLNGQPTAIVGGVQEHRHDIAGLLSKLAAAAVAAKRPIVLEHAPATDSLGSPPEVGSLSSAPLAQLPAATADGSRSE